MLIFQEGWPHFQRLLVIALQFLEPSLRNAQLPDAIRLFYKGTLKILLVLLHDFPEFLCSCHFSFCDVIPSSCIQMRNVILSSFPGHMRLPDPFTPNLKVRVAWGWGWKLGRRQFAFKFSRSRTARECSPVCGFCGCLCCC